MDRFHVYEKEKVVDVGPIEIPDDKEKSVNSPPYAGGSLLIARIVDAVSLC